MPLDGSDYGPVKQLRDAIDVIDRAYGLVSRGFAKCWYFRVAEQDYYCALGALTQAINQNETPDSHKLQLQSIACREHPAIREFCNALDLRHYSQIIGWNDRIGVTSVNVLSAFTRAKASLQRQLEKIGV